MSFKYFALFFFLLSYNLSLSQGDYASAIDNSITSNDKEDKSDILKYYSSFKDLNNDVRVNPLPNQDSIYNIENNLTIQNRTINSEDEKDSFNVHGIIDFYSDTFGQPKSTCKLPNFRFNFRLPIKNCKYSDYLNFKNCKFDDRVDIYNKPDDTTIGSIKCNFLHCTFDSGICFNSQISFSNHHGQISINGTVIKNTLRFEDCRIGLGIDLSNCSFEGNSTVTFDDKTQVDYINLQNVRSKSIIDLNSIRPYHHQDVCYINLLGSDISKLQFQYQHFQLVFPEDIIKNEEKKDLIKATYEALLANFSKNGYRDSYEKLDIEYKDYKNKRFNFFGYIVPYYGIGYGYHKDWIFWWTFIFLILFTAITFVLYDSLTADSSQNGVYPIKNIPSNPSSNYAKVWFSFLYTSSIFFQITLDISNLNFRRFRVTYVLLVYTIGIVCVGYIANFVLQK